MGSAGHSLRVAVVLVVALAAVALDPSASPSAPPVDPSDPLPPAGNLRIDAGLGNSVWPALAADPWGTVHAAWQDNATGTNGIHYTRSTDSGATWDVPRRLDSPPAGGQSYQADLALDVSGGSLNGTLYAVWQTTTSGAGDIWVARSLDLGGTWDTPVPIDLGPGTALTYRPRVATGAGRVFVVWFDNRDAGGFQVFLRSSPDGGASWTPEVQLSDPGLSNFNPVIAVRGDTVNVAWIRTDLATRWSVEVAASADAGASWQKGEALSRISPEGIRDVHVATDDMGALHLVWIDLDASARQSVRYLYSDDLDVSFRPATVIAAAPVGVALGEVRLSSLGPVVAVAWSDQGAGDYDLFYAWSRGGAWSAPIRIDDTDRNGIPGDDASVQNRPALAGAGTTLYAAWSDTRGGARSDVYVSSAEWSELLVSEVQDSPEGQEFVELYAWSRTPIPVAGWSLDVDGAVYDLSALSAIGPGAHITVGDSASATLNVGIDLDDEGSRVRIRDASASVVDEMGYGQRGVAPDPRPSESAARCWDGVAYGRAWNRDAPATWGAANSAPTPVLGPTVVLNEILFNPSVPGNAFVELFYRGSSPATIAGLYVFGDVFVVLPTVDFSPAQRYYHVFAADAPALFASLGPGGDNVYLSDAAGRLWDEAGWSSPHAMDLTMARAPDGAGSRDAFDDASSVVAGWRFDLDATLPGIAITPDQSGLGDLGTAVGYPLTVRNDLRTAEDVEIEIVSSPEGWAADLFQADGVTPVPDSNGNGVPDLPALAPLGTRDIVVVVHVPAAPPIGGMETTQVSGFAFSQPLIRGNAWLTTGSTPHVEPRKWASPATIYVEGSLTPPTRSTVHLEIVGSGQAIEQRFPQDTIFLIDSSGSMTMPPWNSDPTGMRIDAIKAYIDGMAPTDRAAIVGFAQDSDYFEDFGAWLVNDIGGGAPAHLTWMDGPGRFLMRNNAETMRFGVGGTNIEKALQIAHQEFFPTYRPAPACRDYGRPFPQPAAGGLSGHTWVEILLTDGIPSHNQSCTDDEVAVAAANGIRIFTIGLGASVDELYLQSIATATRGVYYHADGPSDLLAIYDEIATFVSRIAGYDDDVSDNVPMVNDVVPGNITVVPGSFVDPITGAPKPPDYSAIVGGDRVLQWNVSRLDIGDVWAVEYRVSSPQTGHLPVSVFPDAAVTYRRWDAQSVTLSFPEVEIDVLPPPPTFVEVTVTRSPARGSVTVDGVEYAAPARLSWESGDTHEISVPAADPFGPGERDLFEAWDDGGPRTHTITVGDTNTTITAAFLTQFHPTVDLVGTDAVHTVAARFTAARQPRVAGGVSGAWSDWADAGTSIEFDALAAGSTTSERWITLEDFTGLPWVTVTSGFAEQVVYVHQARATLRTSGLAPAAPATIRATTFGGPATGATSGTWSEWVDVGTTVDIENPVQVSPVQRYASLSTVSWTIEGPLDASIPYYRQWEVRVFLMGLEEARRVGLRSIRFGGPIGATPWAEWSDWVDHGGTVSVDSFLTVGSRERFVTRDPTSWIVTSPATVTVQYVHQYKPAVSLVGTDGDHTVSVAAERAGRTEVTLGVHGFWSDWVDANGDVVFSSVTSGTPPRTAVDPTAFAVGGAFDETIRYAEGLVEVPNYKPLLSLVYVVAIAGTGAAVAQSRPLDIFLLPSAARRLRAAGGKVADFRVLGSEDPARKMRKDRALTFLAAVVPFAVAEGAIGVASLLTGFLRVPEAGTWLSLGLLVNTAILGGALTIEGAVFRSGYDVLAPPVKQPGSGADGEERTR